jgi:UDP-N-acetyl-D-galactosamine dehydrogenase
LKKVISVIGLGYVGLPLAVAFSRVAHVIAFDTNPSKIELYLQGSDPTGEVGPEALNQALAGGSIQFTSWEADLKAAGFHIVAVPTPLKGNHTPDLSFLESAGEILGRNLRPGSIVVYESTVYPGCTEEYCGPILEKASGLKSGTDFRLGYSPERINPGDPEHRLENVVKIVSGQDAETLEAVAHLYGQIVRAGVYRAPSIAVAEAAKVIENSQRDINIAFVNELAKIFNKMGIDTQEVLKAAGTKWNFLPFTPGLVGGHCIGVDPYYLAQRAQEYGYFPEIILAGRRLNDSMGQYIAQEVMGLMIRKGRTLRKARVLILGFTFKENCPDVRNTRVVDILRELERFGLEVDIYDPIASPGEIRKQYGLEVLPELPIPSPSEGGGLYAAAILAVPHKELLGQDFRALLQENGVLYDIKGILKTPVDGRL